MKPRLFIGNFDFEHQLAEPKRETPQNLKGLNAELACAWLSIAEDGDYVSTPLPLDDEFLRQFGSGAFPRVVPVTSFREVPRDVECVPWGWSPEIRELVERYGWSAQAPNDDAVRLANSRSTSDRLERLWNIGLPGARRVESIAEFHDAIRSLERTDERWVVKAEFGMSARERILGQGAAKQSDENWVRRRLALSNVVFFEPWVERLGEVGYQFEIPRNGPPRPLGFTPMVVDRQGQYAGSFFAANESRFETDPLFWSAAAEVACRAAEHLQTIGYFGPLGIDAMVYRDRDGTHRIRPLQDINARWTMGRLSLGWRRLLEPQELGLWQHLPRNDVASSGEVTVIRQLITSPQTVGNIPCQRASRILIMSARQVGEN